MKYFIILACMIATIYGSSTDSATIFTDQEKEYLLSKKEITMCIDPDWMPFEKLENGKHTGMTSDYFKLFQQKIGIPIKLIPTASWSESLEFAKMRKCDIFSLAMETAERKSYMNFTKPYLISPLVFITKLDTPFINDPADVLGMQLGITKGYAFVEILKQKYPNINLIEYEKLSDGLNAVSKGKIYAYIDNLYTSGFAIQKNHVGELKIAGKFSETWNLSVGIRNDEPLLLSIFDKTIDEIMRDETFYSIANNWINVKYEQGFDYKLFYQIFGILLVVMLFLYYKHFLSQKYIKQLTAQKEEFEAIFKNSKDGIAIYDLDANFLDFNDAYLEMTGFTRGELLHKNCIELTAFDDKERTKLTMAKVIKDGSVENFEKSCLIKDDRMIAVNMTLSLMPDKKRIIAVVKNITQNKLLESQAKLASMGEMIGNIAHQWRQPLNVISTMASGIAFKKEFGSLKDEEIIPDMEAIIAQTTYLSKTIDDFRNFIKGGEIEEEIVISSLFDKTFSIVDASLKSHYVQTVRDIDSTIKIKGYENELMQAFINIINNAKDALAANETIEDKYIFISAKSNENHCEITIKDNGGGVKPSIINRIFEPYFTTKHQSKGTGLGLSMAHKIITEMHNGTIMVSNVTYEYNGKEYKGASFCITFQEI